MAFYRRLSRKSEKNFGARKEEKSKEEIEDDSDEDDSSEDSLYEGITDFHGEQPGDLSFVAGEVLSILSKRRDGWWTAENNRGKIGLVPSTFLEPHTRFSREDAEDFDGNSPSDDKSRNKIDDETRVSDSWNFCTPSLSKLENENDQYSTSAFLEPKLSESGLSFKDIHWDDASNNLKANSVKCQRLITLTECRHLPETRKDLVILSYHIKMCLHDGSRVSSNIHTVRAKVDSKDPQNWTFSSAASQTNRYLEDGRIFIRTKNATANIGILFQPCLLYKKQDMSGKEEFSYGWAFMRLYDDSGNPVPNKPQVLTIHRGYPFEETTSVKSEERRIPKNLVSKVRLPSISVRVSTPDRDVRYQLNLFPDILIGPVSLIPHIALYRQTLADCLLHQRISSDSTELLQAPVESTFPKLFSYPDILDAFRKAWIEKIKNEKKSNKKDAEKVKQLFIKEYMETAYLLNHCNILPPYTFGDIQAEQAREKEIERLMQIRQTKGHLAMLLASNISCRPFSVHELSMDIAGNHCIYS